MTHISSSRIPGCLLVFLACLLLCTCAEDQILPEDEFRMDFEDFPFGKMKADFGTYAILKPDSTLWMWGMNWSGQLGTGSLEGSDQPIQVPLPKKIIDFDLSAGMVTAVDCDHNIWFWGSDLNSSMMWPDITTPLNCSHLDGVKAIGKLGLTQYILRNDGSVWKINIDPNVESSFYEPEQIPGLDQTRAISQGMALQREGTLKELFPTEPDRGGLIPVRDVIAVQNVIGRRTVVLKEDGTVWAWGQNGFGQLGDGSSEHRTEPVQVLGLEKIVQISANYDFNLALKEDGTVWFWGFTCKWDEQDNPIGIHSPVKIDNLDHAIMIFGSASSMVMRDDGTYWYFDCDGRDPQLVRFNQGL